MKEELTGREPMNKSRIFASVAFCLASTAYAGGHDVGLDGATVSVVR